MRFRNEFLKLVFEMRFGNEFLKNGQQLCRFQYLTRVKIFCTPLSLFILASNKIIKLQLIILSIYTHV